MAATLYAKQQFLNVGDNQDLFQMVGIGGGIQLSIPYTGVIQAVPLLLAASGAVNPKVGALYMITKAGVAALTLVAPTTVADDGVEITIISNTAFAHTLTATALLQSGVAIKTTATFAAFAGATISLTAYAGFWNVTYVQAVTLS